MITIKNPYDKQGVWLKGSFHNHTTNSQCGTQPLEVVYQMYGQYDYLGISDHDVITAHEGERRIPTVFEAMEVSSPEAHMLLVEPPRSIMEGYHNTFTIGNYQRLSDACLANGGISILAHPNRYFSQFWRLEDMLSLTGYTGIEIVNGDGNPEYDVAFDKWDQLLTAGRTVWGFGNDDFHVYGQEKRAWNMVLAERNTNDSILEAVKAGSFYVSTGFDFAGIHAEDGLITVDLPANERLNRIYKYVTLIGKEGQVLHEETGRLNRVQYQCSGEEGYVRIAAYLEGGYGAFSQPLFVEQHA